MKIDKQIQAELELVASKLPPMRELDELGNMKFRFGTFKESGKSLLRSNPGMKDADGKPLNPDKFYKVKLPVYIDHKKEILKAFKISGEEGVKEYCKSMIEAHKLWKQHQINPIKKLGQLLKKVKTAIAENN
jgi:uncharacterized protein (UPF0216 family)